MSTHFEEPKRPCPIVPRQREQVGMLGYLFIVCIMAGVVMQILGSLGILK